MAFDKLIELVQVGDGQQVAAEVQKQLDAGNSAPTILNDGLIAAMDIVGEKMESEEMFIPEVLRSAKAMEQGLAVMKDELALDDVQASGKVVIGTVKGDLHDIGKNLVSMLLSSAGFEVIDAGINVAPDAFVAKVEETGANFLAMSALLTTTMPMMKQTIAELEQRGLRDRVKVIIGGAPVNQGYADELGADGYASDAGAAIKLAKSLRA